MANFLKSVGDYVKLTAWDQPMDITKDLAKGKVDDAFSDWKGTFGDNERGESEIAHSMGIKGWVGDHPTETAGAIAATILGGWAAAGAGAAGAGGAGAGAAGASAGAGAGAATTGAAGAGAASAGSVAGMSSLGGGALGGSALGTGAATTGASATGAGTLGGVGASAYMAPAASGGVATTGGSTAGSALFSSGAGYAGGSGATGIGAGSVGTTPFATAGTSLSYAPTASTTLGGTGGSLSAAGETGVASGVSSTPFTAEGSSLAYSPTESSVLSDPAGTSSSGTSSSNSAENYQRIQKLMNSMKQDESKDQTQTARVQMAPAYRAKFSGSKSSGNQLLSKTMQDIYNNPMYSPLKTK